MSESPEPAEAHLRAGGYDDAVRSDDPLVTFLYLLCRDKLPAGEVERLVAIASKAGDCKFSNDFLAAYAVECAARLRGSDDRAALDFARKALLGPKP